MINASTVFFGPIPSRAMLVHFCPYWLLHSSRLSCTMRPIFIGEDSRMCETQKLPRKQKGVTIDDVLPMDSFENRAISWAVTAATRARDAEIPIHGVEPDDFSAGTKAVLIAIARLADPSIKGSDELLFAIIEERRKMMN